MTVITVTFLFLLCITFSNCDFFNSCSYKKSIDCVDTIANNETQIESFLLNIFISKNIFQESLLWSFLVEYQAWIFSILGSIVVGLSGIFPLLVIPIEEGANLKTGAAAKTLRVLLSFAVGGMLGDVFLHLLPEAWHGKTEMHTGRPSIVPGLWVLSGILLFTVLEMLCSKDNEDENEDEEENEKNDDVNIIKKLKCQHCDCHVNENGKSIVTNGNVTYMNSNNGVDRRKSSTELAVGPPVRQLAGYLNLLANCIDNFMHGLAVGGGFLVSFKMGALTTFAILIHEVPHEIGDFAILLRAGFSRWEAAKAQLYTAGSGLLGALTAVYFSSSSVESRTSWVIPFTAGGFLHIALVTVLPELLSERDKWESIKQLAGLLTGLFLIAGLTTFFD